MVPLSAAELLAVWERGLEKRPPERALALLEAACPDSSPTVVASLSVGRRDAALLTLREWAFGDEMTGSAMCANCGLPAEMTLNTSRLRLHSTDSAATPEVSLETAGCEIRLRLPNSTDLMACADLDATEIPKQLFTSCLIAASMQGVPVSAEQLPPEVVQAGIEQMAQADRQADLEIDISCAGCGHRWIEIFDIVSFFWTEIDAWARRTLREIHVLASAYGWSEKEILLLNPRRRHCYLEMALHEQLSY
jgi:hypothetical protein